MSEITRDQMSALTGMVVAIAEAVKAAGPTGAPGGVLYAALMQHGITLEMFERLMSIVVSTGRIRKGGDCYFLA